MIHARGVFWPAERYTDNGDGPVTNHLTGRVWLQADYKGTDGRNLGGRYCVLQHP